MWWFFGFLLITASCTEERVGVIELDRSIPLGGEWSFRVDPDNRGLEEGWMRGDAWSDGKNILNVPVPGPWEAIPEGAGYDGVAWYMTRFTMPKDVPEDAVAVLAFEAVNYRATVYLDGEEQCSHEGAYVPFRVVIRKPEPSREYCLVLRVADPGESPVDGMTLMAVPHAKESWYYNYGGITGAVSLNLHGPIHVKDVFAAFTAPAGGASEGGNRLSFALENLSDRAGEARFRVRILDPSNSAVLLEREGAESDFLGKRTVEWDLGIIDGLKPWSLEDPRLYEVEVRVEGSGFRQVKRVVTGARYFDLDDDGFQLNGEPLFVRAVLYQPYYPGTLVRPIDENWVRDEVRRIKEAGFNMVRAHIRPAPEPFLDACDRQGLLVMAEPGIGWIRERSGEMAPRVEREVESLVLASRNHPSVVIFGMLNELSGIVHPMREKLMGIARSLDPSRLVTDDSGGWTGSSWYFHPFQSRKNAYVDIHVYLNYPLDEGGAKYIERLGQGGAGPVFVSEFGFGGMTDLEGALEAFEGREHLEDAAEYRLILEEAESDIRSTPLGGVFPSWKEMKAVADGVQSEAALAIGAALLANPRVKGYCYTQYQDVSWELSAGIVDIMGKPKPAYEACKKLNALVPGALPPLPDPAEPPEGSRQEGKSPGCFHPIHLGSAAVRFLEANWPQADVLGGETVAGPSVAVCGSPLSLISWGNAALSLKLFRYVKRGGVLLYLNPPRLDEARTQYLLVRNQEGIAVDLPVTVHYRRNRGSFIGNFHYVDPRTGLLEGIHPLRSYLGAGFGDVLATEAHLPLGHASYHAPAGAFDCYGRFNGGDLLAVPYGRGYFVFSHFKLLARLETSPMARFLLERIVEDSLRRSKPDTGVDEDFVPPTQREAIRISSAMAGIRRLFGFFERLSLQRLDGKRQKYRFPPELFAWNAARLEGLLALEEGRYEEGTVALNRLVVNVPEAYREFLTQEDDLMKILKDLPRSKLNKAFIGEALDHYERALWLFGEGKRKEALTRLEAAFETVPEN